jgi:hypothetical protein
MGGIELLHAAAGAVLALLAWLVPRRVAQARGIRPAALLLDTAPAALSAGLLVLATGRPLFAGVVVLAFGAGLALADHTMRQTLREPAVFSEAAELPQLFTHPHLYLPFAGPGLVLGGAAAATGVGIGLLGFEPPLWRPHPLAALAAAALVLAVGWLLARDRPVKAIAAVLRRATAPTADPFRDSAVLGPFATLLVHTVIARAERPARRLELAAPAVIARRGEPTDAIIVVQCESFFDARRLSPHIPGGLPGFAGACAAGRVHGRFAVPGWGANTMRAEFAVLTGIPEAKLGYDRFNPYFALARKPVASHVWRLREAGYRTVCLHPFDRRFFRRDLAMPALGFDEFRGRETLGGSRRPPYYPDPHLAEDILDVLVREGPGVFVFGITMGNHGPWLPGGPAIDPAVAGLFDPVEIPDGAGLMRYLDGLKRSDEMLEILLDGLERRGLPAVLAFYGDHLPSLSRAFAHFGFAETASDYVIWDGSGAARRQDLQAHELGGIVIEAALAADRSACPARPLPASSAG